MVTLRQLRYLEALADTLHFGQAAETCAVTQPALSMQIKELESELQVSLMERRKSGIEMTEQGDEIVRRGRIILASVRRPSRLRQASRAGAYRIAEAWGNPIHRALSPAGGATRATAALPRPYLAAP
ncbi:MAG TPA: LysR family transcriptional regulator [Bradyrhizobium sp.]|nr:LysR family transcriptional regulator [Bradyrhizobium sp.]